MKAKVQANVCAARAILGRLVPALLPALAICLVSLQLGHAAPAPAKPEPHTFTNADGKSFKGEVANVVDDEVFIEREDGQSFRVKISIFGDADQNYIREWMAKAAAARRDGAFRINVVESKTSPVKTPGDFSTVTTWTSGYNMTLRNQTTYGWDNLSVRSVFIKSQANPGQLPPNDSRKLYVTATVVIENLKRNAEFKISTDKIELKETATNGRNVYANGAPKVSTDAILAFWVRVYDADGRMLFEWSSDPKVTKDEVWETIWRPARGRRGGAAAPASRGPAS